MATLSNESVLTAWSNRKDDKQKELLASIRKEKPALASISDEDVLDICRMAVSNFQSKDGKVLEEHVENTLTIPFQKQVCIDKDGVIVDRGRNKKGEVKTRKTDKIVDIVFGTPVVGTHISEYAAMSLKISSRERGSQDDHWSLTHKPKLFLYATLSDDYPQPDKFGESETRKLVCATPKKTDDRTFKLGFGDIEAEVMRP